jgi:uncharacterized lipoprotein YajG
MKCVMPIIRAGLQPYNFFGDTTMKKLLVIALAMFAIAGCQKKEAAPAAAAPAADAAAPAAAAPAAAPATDKK